MGGLCIPVSNAPTSHQDITYNILQWNYPIASVLINMVSNSWYNMVSLFSLSSPALIVTLGSYLGSLGSDFLYCFPDWDQCRERQEHTEWDRPRQSTIRRVPGGGKNPLQNKWNPRRQGQPIFHHWFTRKKRMKCRFCLHISLPAVTQAASQHSPRDFECCQRLAVAAELQECRI